MCLRRNANNTIPGGISFYSGQFGFVCSNAESYEVVLADGSVVTASATSHADLWRVLKGGSSNFGIVTRITLRSIPSKPLWYNRTYALAAFQTPQALRAFHDWLADASSGRPGAFDPHASSPILSFTYVQALGLQVRSMSLVHTEAPADPRQWPAHWKRTGFARLWSVWTQASNQSHADLVGEFGGLSPAGSRHTMGTTTIRNDAAMLAAAYGVFCRSTGELRRVRGLFIPFIFQAVQPEWMNKGFPNVLGLEGCREPLVIVSVSVKWDRAEDDVHVRAVVRRMFEGIEAEAARRGAGHPYRFMNYCSEWQRPLHGRGEESVKLMREASRKYDPDGLFQVGCAGGFGIP
jgi:FAD/FMN-containing dehydrogenase